LHIKEFWQVKVKLDGGALPGSADGVFDLDIYLGAVKSSAAFVQIIV